MGKTQLSGSDLRAAVFDLVARDLGPDALVTFIAENFSQEGRNYTAQRASLPQGTVDEIIAQVKEAKEKAGGSLVPHGCTAEIIEGD